jgi:hypothetical protein
LKKKKMPFEKNNSENNIIISVDGCPKGNMTMGE